MLNPHSIKTWLICFFFSVFMTEVVQAAAVIPVASKKEQRSQLKTLRKELKKHFYDLKSQHGDIENNQVLAIIFSVILPPVGVLIHQGTINNKFWLSLLLTLIIWLPGVIYSLLVVTGNA